MEENEERRNFHGKDRFGRLFARQTMYVDGVVKVLLVMGCHRCIFFAHLCSVLRCLKNLKMSFIVFLSFFSAEAIESIVALGLCNWSLVQLKLPNGPGDL